MRSVCGCMPTSSAATEIMYSGLSSIFLLLSPTAQLLEPDAHEDERGDQPGAADRDEQNRGELHENSASRGSSRDTFRSSSSASRSFFVSFFGTVRRSRASRSPLPEPLSFGAPWPRMRSSWPSCEPGFTFSDSRSPYGVGTSTVVPRAASGYVTGTSTTRSLPRRSYSFDGATRVTTKRSPGGPPLAPISPLPLSR